MTEPRLHTPATTPASRWVGRLVSGRPSAPVPRARAVAEHSLRYLGTGLLVWIGVIHLHLWLEGYSQIPTNGPLFLVDAVSAFAIAAALVVVARPVVGLAGAGFSLATLGALVTSINVGLFGFKEAIVASYVVLSLVLEAVAALVLLVWTLAVAARR